MVLAVDAAVVVLIAGCGQGSSSLLSPAQVQKAFVREGLRTSVVFDCFAARHSSANKSPCPAEAVAVAQGAPHVVGMIADDRHTVSTTNIESSLEAWVLDSADAANGFDRASYVDASGKTVPPPFMRLQLQNVVVQVVSRGSYVRKIEAALATLR